MVRSKFGFRTNLGDIQIPYEFEDVGYSYKCELTTDDWLFVTTKSANQIIGKTGNVIVDDLDEYEDLTNGVALVKSKSKSFLYHKSGHKILKDPIDDAHVLGDRWIAVKRNGKWAMFSFSGHQITNFQFSNIRIDGIFWVFEKGALLAVSTEELISKSLSNGGPDLEFKFDDLEMISENVLIGFRDDRECMLDDNLRFLIPWGQYEINPDESGWYLKTSEGYRLYDHSEQDIMNQVHPYLETNAGWLALKTDNDWMLLSRAKDVQPSRGYDSLKLLNEFCAFSEAGEDKKLTFSNGNEIQITDQHVKTIFKKSKYLLLESEKSKSIIDSLGNQIVGGVFDELTFFNDSLLKVKIGEHYGLMRLDSGYVINPDYDAIDEEDGLILALKEGKIGSVDPLNGIRISPSYDSRIERFGEYYLVKSEGKFGLVDTLETNVLSFSYDEIQYWNDTSYLTRNGMEWSFIDHKEERIADPVQQLTELVSLKDERVFKYVREGKYGLLSNKNGILLNPEFTDIFNIGDSDNPVFFADQHLDKAMFHVVSYLNISGELLFSKAYTKEEFDRILCDD
jgi:hypothetical protein